MSINRSFDDPCAKKFQESMQMGSSSYVFNLDAWMRGKKCYPGGVGQQCSTYGPLDNTTYGKQVTRDSYLSGRGQALSNCPECEVRWLPEDLFAPLPQLPVNDDLAFTMTRSPKSCENVADVDITQYNFMPSQFQDEFGGLRMAMFGASSKSQQRQEDLARNANNKSAQKGRTSYGWYPTCRK